VSSEIYVGFSRGINHWWTRYLHKEINHCYLMRLDRGRVIVYEKGIAEVMIYTIDKISDKLGKDLLIKWKQVEARQSLFMLNTCVGHAKQILGINKPFIWTPYQLSKYLRRNHGIHEKAKVT
tara:strand:+ start:170 stop:535 length:366 start_codon:yes stop_codon:yes gene_type:complete